MLQGLDWYKANLKTDKDGDLADEFLLEPSTGNPQPLDKPLKVSNVLLSTEVRCDKDVRVAPII